MEVGGGPSSTSAAPLWNKKSPVSIQHEPG